MLVRISTIEHFEYCARQAALIEIDGVWIDNPATTNGGRGHRRTDEPGFKRQRGVTTVRAVPLWSDSLQLTGRADAIEISDEGEVVPVEYKIGYPHGDWATVQVCAQAFCLEDMLRRKIHRGAVWHSGTRRRTMFDLDEALRERTMVAIADIRSMLASGTLPPAVNDERCRNCQLAPHCLPEISGSHERIERYLRNEVQRCTS